MTSPAPSFDNNAWEMLRAVLASWGLGSLEGRVRDMMVNGDSADVIPVKLRETNEYKERFKGNELRRKKGLPALSEAEYLSTEAQYKSIIRQNVGSGVYDTNDNYTKWFETNVSPQELNNRFVEYQDQYARSSREAKDAWAKAGFTPQDAVRTIMDPTITETDLKRRFGTYSIGAEMFNAYGDADFDQDRLKDLYDLGVDAKDARKGFGEVAQQGQNDQFLARAAGDDLSRTDLENAALGVDPNAEQRVRNARQQEDARFRTNYLGTTQGALGREASGQY